MSAVVGQQSIKDIYNLLESNDLSVLDEASSLIRDGINNSPDPWLLFGLDYFIASGNNKAKELISSVRTPHHKLFLVKIDEYLQKTTTKVRALTLIGNVFMKDHVWIHEVVESKAFASIIKILNTDSDIVLLTVSLYNVAILLPKVPSNVGNHLKNLFKAFVRLVGIESKKEREGTSMVGVNLAQLKAAVYAYFLCLYGMYPNSFTTFLQDYFSLKPKVAQSSGQLTSQISSDISAFDADKMKLYQEHVLPMLQQVKLHPKLVSFSKEMEVSKEKWRKMEPHDVLADIAEVCLDPIEQPNVSQEEEAFCHDTKFEMETPKTFSQILTEVSSCKLLDVKPKLFDTASVQSSHPSSIWSPSMIMGLSTPPQSRSISPAPGAEYTPSPKVDYKRHYGSGTQLASLEKNRPSSLNLSAAKSKEGSSLHTTPCDKTPTKLMRFDFGLKSQSLTNTPTKTFKSGSVTTSKDFGICSPDKEDLEVSGINNQTYLSEKSEHAEESYINISYQNASLGEGKENLTNEIKALGAYNSQAIADATISSAPDALETLTVSQQKSKVILSPSAILDLNMRLVAETMPNLLVVTQTNGNWKKFSDPEDEIKSLKTALLQMHCSLLFERHKRQQHTLRARRLKRKVCECMAHEENNIALNHQLKQKEEEIDQLKLCVKEHANAIKKRSEEYKNDCLKLQSRLKEKSNEIQIYKQENARLKVGKQEDLTEIKELKAQVKDKDAELYSHKLQLETHKHNKEVIGRQTDQVAMLQKELLVVGELGNTVRDLSQFSNNYKITKQAEYNNLKITYEDALKKLKVESDAMKMKLQRAEDKVKFYEDDATKTKRLLEEQKQYLENVKSLARGQMKSLEDKYQCQKSISGRMETYAMELYAKLSAMDGSSEFHSYSSNRIKPIQPNPKALTAITTMSGQVFGISPHLSPPIRSGVINNSKWKEKHSSAISEDNKS